MTSSSKISSKYRWNLLRRILKDPKQLTKKIAIACISQSALAQLELPCENITKMSLNSLKSNADISIEAIDGKGGWEQLDEIRLQVKSLAKGISSNRASTERNTPQSLLADLKVKLDKSHRQRLRLLRGYSELLGILRPLAKRDPVLHAKLKRHLATFSIQNFSVVKGGGKIEKD